MAGIALRFQHLAGASLPAALRFGDAEPAGIDTEGHLLAEIGVTLPLSIALAGSIALDMIDADGVRAGMPQQQAMQAGLGLATREQQMLPENAGAGARHQQMIPLPTGTRIAQQQMEPARRNTRADHQHMMPLSGRFALPHAEYIRTRRRARLEHQHMLPAGQGFKLRAAETNKIRPPLRLDHQQMIPLPTGVRIGHQHGHPVAIRLRIDHQQMIPLPVGWWQATYPWPPEPIPDLPAHLRFCRLTDGTGNLIFGCRPYLPPASTVVPIREIYIVINSFSLVIAGTGQPVPADNFSASIDADTWAWSWSATLPGEFLSLVAPPAPGEYVELIATINGTAIRVVVERLARDRRFVSSTLRISGRGRAAWLADPHALVQTRINESALTAQQLADEALKFNGVSIGWGLDWRIEDWDVPAGAWSHTGTYIDAVNRIAEAGGAYVQGHNTDQTLIILPRYPIAPWAWGTATPDLELPDAPIEVEGIEWMDRPGYNAVFIAGGEAGRLDRILKAGSAADVVAQTIIDPLATAPAMTRQRGLALLGDTGRQAHITIRLPILPETGIIQPGKLVRYTEQGTPRVGLSRAVSIDTKFPEAWQTVRLETHE